MQREFVDLVNETVDEGFTRGIDLFLEALETDLEKDQIFQEHGVDNVIQHLYEEAGVEISETEEEETDEDIDDEKLDAMLKELESDSEVDEE